MSDEPDAYQSYLLRLWRARCQWKWQWRASLESRRTGEHQVFGSLEQFFAFLNERCEGQERSGDSEPREFTDLDAVTQAWGNTGKA